MVKSVKIGNSEIGPGHPCFIIAEIGINHNGDMGTAKELINASVEAGCDAVKFQKRTIETVYTEEELGRPRDNPFGPTNGDLKRGLEFGKAEYTEINDLCESSGMMWFASCWDELSVDFCEKFNPVCYKIASASLTDDALLKHHRDTGRPIVLSTGMSTLEQIDHAVTVLGTDNLVIMHATSTYPSGTGELNISCIPMLIDRYDVPIGYSGHEVGLVTSAAAVALGACAVERHITLDRSMWGSDQSASIEPHGFSRLVRDIRTIETAMGDGQKIVYDSELPIREKLRRVDTQRLAG